MRRSLFLAMTLVFALPSLRADDWIHWRGPEQNGRSPALGLPDDFSVDTPGKEGLLWKKPFGGRSAPLVLNGSLYTISGYDAGLPTEGERVCRFDATTGDLKWEKRFNVFHTDIVSSRLGWTSLTADPEKEYIYAHSTGGFLFCFDKEGTIVWKHQLTEEYGRVTGYGGRIVSPICDSGLVIVGMVNGSWGDQARGGNRFVAFDKNDGRVVWWSEPGGVIKGTYYSNPVIAVIKGERLLITGGADGAVHALKVRTGEKVWSHNFSTGVVNPSPVVDGDLVYICHGEENPEGGPIGRVICLDASQVDAKTRTLKLLWERKDLAKRFGLASPAFSEGRLYVPDDASELHCFDGKSGKLLWRERYGTVARGAPMIADGKLYIFDVNASLTVFKLNGDKKPNPDDTLTIPIKKSSGEGFVETHGTPIAVNNRLYFLTQEALYCIGNDGKGTNAPLPLRNETPYDPKAEVDSVRLFPAEVTVEPGEAVTFEAKFLDASGRELNPVLNLKTAWTLPQPPLPKEAKPGTPQPPALHATIDSKGISATITIAKLPRQQGVIEFSDGKHTARARVRVAPKLPYAEDFEKLPEGAAPGGWVNVQGKYKVVLREGTKVLSKVNTDSRPPIARANAYITTPDAKDYSIQCQLLGTEVGGKFPDMGVVNSRYTLILDGKTDLDSGKRQARIVTWEARPRLNQAVPFDWKPGTWYSVKLVVEQSPKEALVRAKIWPKGEKEPADWTVSLVDPSPNREGAAALYGYVSNASEQAAGSEIFYDDVIVNPLPTKKESQP